MKPVYLYFLLFLCSTSFGQTYPKDYFRCPLDIPISLAGNFGEMRPNHFHAGLDMRTGREGLKVHASADGYVSRIKISTSGYGKVIYLTHPNGFVTVYGHLSRFNGAIDNYVLEAQAKNESAEIEVFPKPGELQVLKGDIIAFSGNTGNSGGPHVHFEIRDAKTEFPINPLLFGLNVPDTVKPKIKQLVVYPLTGSSSVNGASAPIRIPVSGKNGNYSATNPSILKTSGPIGLGIETSDRENTPGGDNQVYSIELTLDSKRVFYYEMNTFGFDETRYVNAHLDYSGMKQHGAHVQRCFLVKNNRCSIYKEVADSGKILIPKDGKKHRLGFVVKDMNGNTATAEVIALGSENPAPSVSEKPLQSCRKAFRLEKDDFRIDIPANVCYEDYPFKYAILKPVLANAVSMKYQVGDENLPLQDGITLSIPTTDHLSSTQTDKAVLVKIEGNGKTVYEGGHWGSGWMTGTVKEFGAYTVVTDVTPPALGLKVPVSSGGKVVLKKGKQIRFTVSDNLSGVKMYKALLDGKWILMEYEPKLCLLFINTDVAGFTPGEHLLQIHVEDEVENSTELKIRIVID